MVFELLLFPAAAGFGLALKSVIKNNQKEDVPKIIKEVFENLGVGIRKGKGKETYIQFPKLIAKHEKEEKPYDVYIYGLPKGIAFESFAQVKGPVQDALGRPLVIEFGDRIVIFKIAKQDLPSRIPLQPFLSKEEKWRVLIGLNQYDEITHNFDDYPHVVGGGTTRFGKTILLKNIMTQLILQNPENVRFWIIDLKGGVEFWEFENLKQVKSVTSKPIEAHELLKNLNKKLDNRMKFFKRKGYKNIVHTSIKQRDFIIIDESHDLFSSKDHELKKRPGRGQPNKREEIEYYVGRMASMGGGFGFRLMVFTQYPVKEALPMFIKQNAPVRIGFQVADQTASRVVMDDQGLESLPGIPGRCIVKSFKYETVQVPAPMVRDKKERRWELIDHYELVKQYEVKKVGRKKVKSERIRPNKKGTNLMHN
ncbi:FtsK/SpoIIIE domain-containing protein [Alkalihalobacillus sp. BA299]|uniref:FtsK/SpoIIIE domain-containing protein n=1 Tax=Alkalihalobacillus sp. BA299 TaxID=2815938 RepID=UPI001AD99EBB|nr:FtsK/SpoIIIE domain-containing protein [Alkalihalobacillus sp. BA299]